MFLLQHVVLWYYYACIEFEMYEILYLHYSVLGHLPSGHISPDTNLEKITWKLTPMRKTLLSISPPHLKIVMNKSIRQYMVGDLKIGVISSLLIIKNKKINQRINDCIIAVYFNI